MISKEKKAAIIAEYGRTAEDTGSPEVQIAISDRNELRELTEHLKEQSEGSSFQTWSVKDGRSETWSS